MVPTEDAEVSKELLKHYKKLGVDVRLGTKVEKIEDTGSGVKVTVSKDGKEEVLETDKVLQAIGFAPRLDGYGSTRPASRPPSAVPSPSTSAAAPTSRASGPSATSPAS